jgi:hypothetical protein
MNEPTIKECIAIVEPLYADGIGVVGKVSRQCITIDTDNARQVSRASVVLGELGYSFYRSGAGETIFTVDR